MNPQDPPNFYITEANFYQLTGPGFWKINDVPPERWQQIAPFLGAEKTLGVFASGQSPKAIAASEAPPKIGGIDWMRLEPNPRPGEPPVNVNHFVIGASGQQGFPVWGPYRSGSIADHWMSSIDQIDRYDQSKS